MLNTDFDPIYAGGGSFAVYECFGEVEAKAMEEDIKKRQEEYEAAMDAREDALKEAVLNGTSYNDYFNIDSEQPQFGSDSEEELIELMGSGLENIALDKDLQTTKLIMSENTMTLDLNGKKLSRDVKSVPSSAPVLYVTDGVLTITGNGEIMSDGSESDINMMCVWAGGEDAKVVIENGKFYGSAWMSDSREIISSPTIYATKGVIEINGGEFRGSFSADLGSTQWEDGTVKRGSYCLLNCLDAAYKNGEANIVVKGGKFFNFNPAACNTENPATNFVADGYTVKVNGVEDLEKWEFAKGDCWYIVVKK